MSISKQFVWKKRKESKRVFSVPTSFRVFSISWIAEERSVARLPRDRGASERPAVRRLPRAAFLQPRKSAKTHGSSLQYHCKDLSSLDFLPYKRRFLHVFTVLFACFFFFVSASAAFLSDSSFFCFALQFEAEICDMFNVDRGRVSLSTHIALGTG